MNIEEFEVGDTILRHLYEKPENEVCIWSKLYQTKNIDENTANYLLRYLKSRDFIISPSKGAGGKDGFSVSLTPQGFKFFAEDTLVKEVTRKAAPPISTHNTGTQIFIQGSKISGSQFGNRDITTNKINNSAEKKESWLVEYKKHIIGLVFALLATYIAYKLGWG